MTRSRLALALVIAALLGIRFALFAAVHPGRPEALAAPDTPSYEGPAGALLRRGTFSSSITAPGDPEVTRTPGYPLFIAAVQGVAGPSRAAVVVAQIPLIALGLLFLHAGAIRLGFTRNAALTAVILAGLDPGSLLASQMVLPEALFTVLLTAMLYCGVRMTEETPGARWWGLATGLALAAATQVRPITYYFIAPLVLWCWAACRLAGRTRRDALALGTLVLLPWLVLVGGWQVRNARVFGDATFSQIQNVNLYRYRGAAVVAAREGITLDDAQALLQKEADANELTGPERYRYFKTAGIALLRANPGLALRSTVAGFVRTVLGPGCIDLYMYATGPLPEPGPLSGLAHLSPVAFWHRWVIPYPTLIVLLVLEGIFLAVLYAGSAATAFGSWSRIRATPAAHALWWGCAVYLLVVSAGPEAYARFRVPVTPVLACYAAPFVVSALGRANRRAIHQ
jgi:4-amino-4-deoxy-L-arabinose transferase-like glycosyltransferase